MVKTRMVKKDDFDTVLLTQSEKASLRSQYSDAIKTIKREKICIKNHEPPKRQRLVDYDLSVFGY